MVEEVDRPISASPALRIIYAYARVFQEAVTSLDGYGYRVTTSSLSSRISSCRPVRSNGSLLAPESGAPCRTDWALYGGAGTA